MNTRTHRTGIILAGVLMLLLCASSAHAATIASGKSLTIATSTPDNAYLVGTGITVTAPLPADLSALGGTVSVFAPIEGDAMLAGGTVDVEKPIQGDLRTVGARVTILSDVTGDVLAAGGRVDVSGTAHDMLLAGASVHADANVAGPVTIYGADVTLGGNIEGDVQVIASDRFTLLPGTRIHGTLRYNAPIALDTGKSYAVDGGITYTGSYSYVPTNADAQKFAIAGAGIFFIVRVLAVAIAAALLALLFPEFAARLRERALEGTTRRRALTPLLGFAILVTAPVLLLLLAVSFVGIGIALLAVALYALLVMLSYLYAGVLLGALSTRLIFKKGAASASISWQRAFAGMIAFFLLGLVPYIGWLLTLFGVCAALGAISALCFRFAFSRSVPIEDL